MPVKATPQAVWRKLAALYTRMDAAYAAAAARLGLSCAGCADNCCVSFFQHHTYVEWAYLWQGMNRLDPARRQPYLDRAALWVRDARLALAAGNRPRLMCPLNDDGLCGVYDHRLMICRLHGVPNEMVRPDGRRIAFPGCSRAQELTAAGADPAPLDRTPLYRDLAGLEQALLGARIHTLPRVDMTLAEMLVQGPPELR